MSPTVFSASEQKKEKKVSQLREKLKEEQVAAQKSPIIHEEPPEENTSHVIKQVKKKTRVPNDYSQVLREDRSYKGIFSSFITQPNNVHFETQHENEKILMLLRQHPIVNVRWFFLTILLIIAPFILLSIFPFLDFLPTQFDFFAWIGWYLLVFVFAIEGFLSWYYNIYIITDERIVDVDFYSLLYRSVSEAKLDKIEDVTSTMAGLSGAMFNFGTITIQTAAEKREFEFVNVPNPAKITKFINEMILEEEREKIEGRVS